MSDPADPERELALSYAPRDRRAGLAALFTLDDTLAQILRGTREPLVGQMRLTWWHGALAALDTAPPPAQPVLQALAAEVLPRGVTGAQLARMIDGWEVLLDDWEAVVAAEETDYDVLVRYGQARGATLFIAAGLVLGCSPEDPVAAAGEGWALADLCGHLSDLEAAAVAGHLSSAPLKRATASRWSPAGRPLGALAHVARMDQAYAFGRGVPRGAPRRVARMAWHRISGR